MVQPAAHYLHNKFMERVTYIYAMLTALLVYNGALAVATGFKAPDVPDFSRYLGILNRMPGAAPVAPPAGALEDPKAAAQEMKEKQLLARKINMACVNITPSGTPAVGFTDLSQKPAVNFYLLVGSTGGGWTLKSADYAEEWAELEKDGTTIFVKLGQGLMTEPPKKHQTLVHKNHKNQTTPHTTSTENNEEIDNTNIEFNPEEQFVTHKAYELAGGPPAPEISLVPMAPEESLRGAHCLDS